MSSLKTQTSPPNEKPPLVVIVGPTAVGKTETAIKVAQAIHGEIVSADSRLFYRGMDIGTAKPSLAERRTVPHHLIDVAEPDESWSLAVFQQAAAETIAAIHQRGNLPLLVGGTGQYIHAVTQAWLPPELAPDPHLRRALEGLAEKRGSGWLHERLALLDPASALSIDGRNVRRTVRALEVILSTGRRYSDQRNRGESPFRTLTIGLIRPRAELYARIDARIEAMFANGLLEEVRGLMEKGCSASLPTMSAIGYRECVSVLEGKMSIEEAKIQMRRLTRIFVRRQANWFKNDDPQIHWFEAEKDPAEAILRLIRQTIPEAIR